MENNKTNLRDFVSIEVPDYGADDVMSIRTRLGLTQQGLATYVGVSQRTLRSWEMGVTKPGGPPAGYCMCWRKNLV